MQHVATSETSPTPVAAERNVALDGARVIAAAAVVMVHVCAVTLAAAGPSVAVRLLDSFATFGMPFFFSLAGYLQARSRLSGVPWLASRLRRIGLPYVAWTFVYLAYSTWVSVADGTGIPRWNAVSVIFLGGANASLWFLPAVLYCGVAVMLAGRRWLPWLVGIALMTDVLMLAGVIPVPANPLAGQLSIAFMCYAAGYLMASATPPTWAWRPGLVIAVAAPLISAWAAVTGNDPLHRLLQGLGFQAMFAVGALLLAWALTPSARSHLPRLARFAPLTLGIYLSHTLLSLLAARLWPPQPATALVWVLVAYPLVLFASAALTAGLRAGPLRWTVE